jgi:D-alanine--D-alanine ligase
VQKIFTMNQNQYTKNRIRVGVLMGGRSIEREVSFNSGRTICDHLDISLYEVIPLFQMLSGELFILPPHFLHRGKTTDFEHRLDKEAQKIKWDDLPQLIDFVYIATHGRFAEDGTLQGFLEVLKIPYLGASVLASAMRMDKIIHKKILQSHGIHVPLFKAFYPTQIKDPFVLAAQIDEIEKILPGPWVIKPHKEGSSLGIQVVFDKKDLSDAILKAAHVGQSVQAVVVEQKIEGMEFSCIILIDNKTGQPMPLSPTEIIPEAGTFFYDYEQKYMRGRATKFTPARCSEELIKKIQETCIAVMKILEFKTIARIDGFLKSDGSVIIIDPNSLSGMGPTSFLFLQAACHNMSHTDLINHLIETSLIDKEIAMVQKVEEETDSQQKIRIAVIFGGASHEKETSLESGRNVLYKLSPHKYEPIPLFLSKDLKLYHINQRVLVSNSTKEIELLITEEMRVFWNDLPDKADFVFLGLHGGVGENGSIQGTLEMLNLPYNGPGVFTSALCMDKFKTNEFLSSQGFDVPQHILVTHDEWKKESDQCIKKIIKTINFPLIVKPHDDGCSVLVQKISDQNSLIKAIELLFADGKTAAFIEEYIIGMELTVGVLGNENPQALPPTQCVTAGDILTVEEKFLPGAGENQTPALLPAKVLEFVKQTIEKVFVAVEGFGYARIDCFYQNESQSPTGKERLVILEINTLPGLTPATCIFHQAAEIGIRPMEFIDKIIELGFEQHGKKIKETNQKGISYPFEKLKSEKQNMLSQ